MAIESIPVWTIPPDWQKQVTETLEWLTAILVSPFGVEQRLAGRLSPRQSLEMSVTLYGPHRTFFDLFILRLGALPFYAPLWYEIEKLVLPAAAGTFILPLNTAFTELATANYVFIQGDGPFDYEIAEVDSADSVSITLTTALVNNWPVGTKVYPLKKCLIETQPQTTRKADRALISTIRFISLEPNPSVDLTPLAFYGDQYVLEQDPNETTDLAYSYDHISFPIDNKTGLQERFDVTGLLGQQFTWYAKTKAAHSTLRGLFHALQGRRMPIWVPTIYADFDLVDDVLIGDDGLNVKRCGYTDLGGPTFQREHILIELKDGQRFYRKILDAVLIGGGETERLLLSSAFTFDLRRAAIRRISFLTLCRLDQDSIEIVHYTDTKGVCTVSAVFKTFADRESIVGIEVPAVNTDFSAVCINDFRWSNFLPASNFRGLANDVDMFGNVYVERHSDVQIYSPAGVVLSTLTQIDLADGIDAWFGSPVVSRGPFTGVVTAVGFPITPIMEGQYVLAHLGTTHYSGDSFAYWYAILTPSETGNPTVIGAVYYDNLLGPPYLNPLQFLGVSNTQTVADPIIVMGSAGGGGSAWYLAVLPSVAEIIAGDYHDGYPGFTTGVAPCHIPRVLISPIGTPNFSSYSFVTSNPPNGNMKSAYLLPNSSGGTNIYMYMNRAFMDWNEASSGTLVNPAVKAEIQPLYPLGAMVKIDLGVLDTFPNLADYVISHGGAAIDLHVYDPLVIDEYIIDNANWVDIGSTPVIPFDDEYVYNSNGLPGGNDVYTMEPGAVIKRSATKYWVVYCKPGMVDAAGNTAGTLYETIRLFEYNSTTEVAVELQKITCIVYTNTDIVQDGSGLRDFTQAIRIVVTGDIATLYINGYETVSNDEGHVYQDSFCQFVLPG